MADKSQTLRNSWMKQGLSRESLSTDPFEQFQLWYEQAIESAIPEPNAMIIATVDGGQPEARTVLLKTYDRNGFVFFTNYESDKARQIDAHPSVSILFSWVALGRQIRINGTASRVPTAESVSYFATRPRGSQIGAWASPQSQVITSRSLLETKIAEMKTRFAQGDIPLPDFWGGYRVVPERFEFWQARDDRVHDRFVYVSEGGGWSVDRIAP